MKCRATVLVALLFGGSGVSGFQIEEAQTSAARAWLRSHKDAPNADELAELKDTNPSAYALVKALLTKRSLGLLDPKHPTSSFAKKPSQADDVPQGPDAFAKFASTADSTVALPAQETEVSDDDLAPAPVVHKHLSKDEMLNWRPEASAADEDSAVASVLGAAHDAAAAQPSKSLLSQSRGETVSDAAAPEAQAVNVAPAQTENRYLDSLGGFGSSTKASLIKETSQQDHTDYLSSFSWDSSSDTQKQRSSGTNAQASAMVMDAADFLGSTAPAASAAPKKSEAKTSGDALSKWLR